MSENKLIVSRFVKEAMLVRTNLLSANQLVVYCCCCPKDILH